MNEASQLTRTYADTVLAPLDRDEATTATRQALEAVLRQSTIRRDRLRIYAPSLRIEKPELRDGAPRRMIRVRIRDRDRGVVHELSIEADKIVDHVIDADANPPFSDEEREDAFRVLSKHAELGKIVARQDIEIEWFNPGGHGRGRVIGARLVRVDDYRVIERVTEAEVELNAKTDLEAVRIDTEAETSFDPATLVISSKFECGWYQYVQRWEFNKYGDIHADLGMGGTLHPANADKAHVHHMYFRVDLDIDGWSSDVFEVFSHKGFDDLTSGDAWTVQNTQGKHLLDPNSSRKFRIRDLTSATAHGVPTRGYEFETPAQAGTDTHSTADIWATLYRGDAVEQGEKVGMATCSDLELDQIAAGPFDTTKGSDIVAWVVVRHHHEPRHMTEEREFLPYHYEGFHITPRAFEIFRPPDDRNNPDRPPHNG